MNALALSAIIFVLTLGGIFLGMLLRRTLPEHYLDEHAKDVVRLGVGLIATIVDLILLDNILAQHGSEAHLPREQIRRQTGLSRGVKSILMTGLTVTTLLTSVATASAQNIFESLFGRLWNSPVATDAIPNAPLGSPEATRSEGGLAYCVRLRTDAPGRNGGAKSWRRD